MRNVTFFSIAMAMIAAFYWGGIRVGIAGNSTTKKAQLRRDDDVVVAATAAAAATAFVRRRPLPFLRVCLGTSHKEGPPR